MLAKGMTAKARDVAVVVVVAGVVTKKGIVSRRAMSDSNNNNSRRPYPSIQRTKHSSIHPSICLSLSLYFKLLVIGTLCAFRFSFSFSLSLETSNMVENSPEVSISIVRGEKLC